MENGLTVFVSDENDAVAFDGWLVRSLSGFGKDSITVVHESQPRRVVTNGNRIFATLCDQWIKSMDSDGQTVWSQPCDGQPSENRIVLNAEGLIIGIHQFITESGGELTLRKL